MSSPKPHPGGDSTPPAHSVASEATSPAALQERPLTWILLASKFGVSVQTIKVWRERQGAPVTTNLTEWELFVKANKLGGIKETAGGSLRDEKTRHEIELLKAKIAKEHRRVIDRDEVSQILLHISTRARTKLYQFLETEAPPKLDGLPAVSMRPILREMADSICDEMADIVGQFERQ